jgi:acetyl-CoA acyltransferase
MRRAVIVDIVRTPAGRGKMGGALSAAHPVHLLSTALTALIDRVGIDPVLIDDVIAGCVGQAKEQAVNIGRQGVLAAGWPDSIPATTIDRQCGSSQQAVHFAAQGIMAGSYDIAIACGVESMSRVPIGAPTMGLDPYGPAIQARYAPGLVNQGVSAELIATKWGIGRDQMDDYAARSHARAAATAARGGFDNEIVPVMVDTGDGVTTVERDETIRPDTTAEGLAGLRPSFRSEDLERRYPEIEWAITPGNSSPLTDGASASLLMGEDTAAALGLRPRAAVLAMAVAGDDPILMLTGPIPATRKVLERARMSIEAIDAYEVNEAFAPVPLVWQRELGAVDERLNPRGGAIALGHALGSSGTRLMATLINHLEATGGRFGLQTMCEGGGMANATIIERL